MVVKQLDMKINSKCNKLKGSSFNNYHENFYYKYYGSKQDFQSMVSQVVIIDNLKFIIRSSLIYAYVCVCICMYVIRYKGMLQFAVVSMVVLKFANCSDPVCARDNSIQQ